MNTTKIHVRGMHCASCQIIIEEGLQEIENVKKVFANFKKNEVIIEHEGQINKKIIEKKIQELGYEIAEKKVSHPWFIKEKKEYMTLLGTILILVALILIGKAMGLNNFNFGIGDPNNLWAVFLIGLAAGLSTCIALVGGLLLAVSARYAETHPDATKKQKFVPHIYFNLGRIISFFFFGGLLGMVGEVFIFSTTTTGYLNIIVGIAMILIGIQLIGISPKISSCRITLPQKIGKIKNFTKKTVSYSSGKNILSGALTFFLPCGFTQSIQLLAISTGSFWMGAMIMAVFAIGTLPGLLAVGGATASIKSKTGIFFKIIGLIVIAFAIFNIRNGLNLARIELLNPITTEITTPCGTDTNTTSCPNPTETTHINSEGIQILRTTFKSVKEDIFPTEFHIKNNQPVRMEIEVLEDGKGCMSTIMIPGLYDTPIFLKKGSTITMEFTPTKTGRYLITCAMGIPRGKVFVE